MNKLSIIRKRSLTVKLKRETQAAIKIQRQFRKHLLEKYKHKTTFFLIKTLSQANFKRKLKYNNCLSSFQTKKTVIVEDKRKIDKLFQITQNNRLRQIDKSGYIFIKSDFNKQDFQGYTPLHYAALNNNFQMCKRLLEEGANCNIQSKEGTTATHLVYKSQNIPLIQLFLKHGADLDICDNFGRTPLVNAKVGKSSILTSNLVVTRINRSQSQINNNIQLKLRRSSSILSPRLDDYLDYPIQMGRKYIDLV